MIFDESCVPMMARLSCQLSHRNRNKILLISDDGNETFEIYSPYRAQVFNLSFTPSFICLPIPVIWY